MVVGAVRASGTSSLPVLKCVRPGFLVSWRFSSAKKLRATGASVSRHKANTAELRGTPSPAQQLCLPVTFSHFLVLNGFRLEVPDILSTAGGKRRLAVSVCVSLNRQPVG